MFGPAPGQALYLRQALGVLRQGLAGGQARQEGRPVPGRRLLGAPLSLVGLHLLAGAGLNLLRDTGKPESFRHQPPGCPGGGRRKDPMEQFRQLPQVGRAALQQLPGLREGALRLVEFAEIA